MARSHFALALARACALSGALVACGGAQEQEKPKTAASQDNVPANSGFVDPRADGKPDAKHDAKPEAAPTPGGPAPTPLAAENPQNPAASPPASKTGPKVSKAECEKTFDKYIQLAIGGDERLAGVTKDMIAEARAGATAQKGDPCVTEPPTRAQYNCAMAAKTTGQWESCMR